MTIKSQISSTKLQINLNFQYSMTKTFTTRLSHGQINYSTTVMMPLDIIVGGMFVWPATIPSAVSCIRPELMSKAGLNCSVVSNFEFGSLGFIWDLDFGAWNFIIEPIWLSGVQWFSKY
jgi:hypothetical protein